VLVLKVQLAYKIPVVLEVTQFLAAVVEASPAAAMQLLMVRVVVVDSLPLNLRQ
jgi:hypothetical protein